MRVKNVHKLAEFLISIVSTPNPLVVGMAIPHEFCHVYDTTEHVTEFIEVLNHIKEFTAGVGSSYDSIC